MTDRCSTTLSSYTSCIFFPSWISYQSGWWVVILVVKMAIIYLRCSSHHIYYIYIYIYIYIYVCVCVCVCGERERDPSKIWFNMFFRCRWRNDKLIYSFIYTFNLDETLKIITITFFMTIVFHLPNSSCFSSQLTRIVIFTTIRNSVHQKKE